MDEQLKADIVIAVVAGVTAAVVSFITIRATRSIRVNMK